MSHLSKKQEDARRALQTLEHLLKERQPDEVVRDASIQRFEYTVEAVWKCLQLYLKEAEGIECNSPKSCLREAGNLGILDPKEVTDSLDMIDDRNATSHTYHVEVAQRIMARLPRHAEILNKILEGMRKNS